METDTKISSEFEYESYKDTLTEEYHYHDKIEIIYVKSGHIRLRTNMSADVCDLFGGDYAIVNIPDIHRIFYMESSEIEKYRFPISYLNIRNSELIEKSFVVSGNVLREDMEVFDCVESIRLLLSRTSSGEQVTRNLCSTLYMVFLSYYPKRKIETNSDTPDSFELQNKISLETVEKFYKALNYIMVNFANSKINLEMLSLVSGLNKTFLSALFPKMTGRNFKDYINRLKVDKAIELLTTSRTKISDIAFMCGFETIRSLNNVFKSITGVTPSDMRLSSMGGEANGIYTEVDGRNESIFNYNWTSNVLLEKDYDKNELTVACTESKKTWCHLILKMLFFPKRYYDISFKAKLLDETAKVSNLKCNFCFPDEITHIEHHCPRTVSCTELDGGWYEYRFSYVVPDYYKTTSTDNFSIFTSPVNGMGQGYVIKDIVVKCE